MSVVSALRRLLHGSKARDLRIERYASYQDWRDGEARRQSADQRRRAYEVSLLDRGETFEVEGECYICRGPRSLAVDYLYAYPVDGRQTPNWRERLVCPTCGLNNRMRAALHLLKTLVPSADRDASVYLTEQTTPLYEAFARRFPSTVGSEFLGDAFGPGELGPRGLRHEDLTRLSFGDQSFDLVVSFDVLEHVPAYLTAFDEILRVLSPGGTLYFTVPFRVDRGDNLVRARLAADGSVEHLLEPEYHGDPLVEEGCLAFYHYGWQLLDDLRSLGFVDVALTVYWSQWFGYLGRDQLVLTAAKPA